MTAPNAPSPSDPARLAKHSVRIAGHDTSLSLEAAFWDALKAAAARRGESVNALLTRIDAARHGNLSSAVRVWLLQEVAATRSPTPADDPEAGPR